MIVSKPQKSQFSRTKPPNNDIYLEVGCCLGRPFFCFMNKILSIGGKKPLNFEDLYKMDSKITFENDYPKFRQFYNKII